jgi:hypothetical protein
MRHVMKPEALPDGARGVSFLKSSSQASSLDLTGTRSFALSLLSKFFRCLSETSLTFRYARPDDEVKRDAVLILQ